MIADLLRASRPLSWINTAYPFAAAYLLTTREIDAALVIGALFFLVPYNLALYGINDVFDYVSDLANPRKGGVEGALLPPERHHTILVASLVTCAPFVIALVVLGPPLSWAVLAVSLFALVAYSAPPFRFKEVPVLDSLTSSVHFVSPAAYGLALAQVTPTAATFAVLGAFLLWGMASHSFGAVQDVVPDRDARISSIATALGAARTVRLALAAWTAAGFLVATIGPPAAYAGLLVLPYLALALPYVRLRDEDSARANGGWRHFLWVNYAAGAAVTMILILYALQNGGTS